MRPLPNPERLWRHAVAPPADLHAFVARRLGDVAHPPRLLGGGRANLNVRMGSRVLRVYVREPDALRRERTLLARGWRAFRVPAVLDAGSDFLVLEYVPHRPLTADPAAGGAAGRALAEIHATRFDGCGFLDEHLLIASPLPDLVAAVHDALSPAASPTVARALAHLGARRDVLREHTSPVLNHADFKASNLHWTHGGELLVLDWEFAYAGPHLCDVGQLMRWDPGEAFAEAFRAAYVDAGGRLPPDWRRLAETFDLINLAFLAARAEPGDPAHRDLSRRVDATVERT